MLGNDICLCIAGNKIDLEKERHVSVEEAEAWVDPCAWKSLRLIHFSHAIRVTVFEEGNLTAKPDVIFQKHKSEDLDYRIFKAHILGPFLETDERLKIF